MKSILIVLNLLAALLILPAMHLVHKAYFVRCVSMYVELDRAQVINREQLHLAFPMEYENDRRKIPELLFGQFYRVKYLAYPCIVGFLLNAALISRFMRKGRDASPSQ
ncbi:MAG TPA: hypothetical protein DCZ95_11890 [Verrucomicrobia bacterium]|nr:MAG: hypothetical protein A2X46_13935 [Lentisphaerae bacterium GWF2_57_35]HBA84786.1 hypothetical protein [Verrucomicrobiota bacterium]